ncbi:MAG: GNAT family N-acetyltransferase [Methanomassiliicoccales archaeon]|nr:GNAT family N-acetyltransferase [Methanomassiliicoccales archaeon]
MLKGALVGLVPLQTTDELALYRWLNDPKMRQGAGRPNWRACYSLEQVQDIIRDKMAHSSRFDLVAVDLLKQEPLGLVEITHIQPMSDSAQISLLWDDQGDEEMMGETLTLASMYAFDTQSLHRIWTRVPSTNQVLLSVLQRIGFKVEGVLREDHFSGGSWCDSMLLAMLSTEARPC